MSIEANEPNLPKARDCLTVTRKDALHIILISSMFNFVNAHFSGEIGTKGGNRSMFVSRLKSNLRHTLGKRAEKVSNLQERLLISVSSSSNAREVAELCSQAFGISWSAPCVLTEIEEEKVASEAAKILKQAKAGEFYVIAKRSDKGLKVERGAFGKKVAELITQKTGIKGSSIPRQ